MSFWLSDGYNHFVKRLFIVTVFLNLVVFHFPNLYYFVHRVRIPQEEIRTPPLLSEIISTHESKLKVAVLTIDIGSNLRDPMLDNLHAYCGRHAYDLIIAREEYSFFDHFPCPWNLPSTVFAATRAALPHYDWVYNKQADTVFINLNISIESIVSQVPNDKHMVIAAPWQGWTNDVAVLWRKSPYGVRLLERLISVQVAMHGCGAAGMAAVMALMLHEFNGTGGIYYFGECERSCERVSHDFGGLFHYTSLLQCFYAWYRKFGAINWHVVENTTLLGGIFIMPGSDEAVINSGRPIVGDDISSFGNGPPQFHDDFFFPSEWFMKGKRVVQQQPFWDRFNTTLALHTGGGATNPDAHQLARDILDIFFLEETPHPISESTLFDLNNISSWTANVYTFNTSSKTSS
jgi:hypothetical protein